MTEQDVYGELSAIVAGRISGRTSDEDVFVFDSTGTALQDVAAAVLVYQHAIAAGAGVHVLLGRSGRGAHGVNELVRYFFKLGTIGFGGPAALVGYMRRDLVEGPATR